MLMIKMEKLIKIKTNNDCITRIKEPFPFDKTTIAVKNTAAIGDNPIISPAAIAPVLYL